MFANDLSNKGLVFRVYNGLSTFNNLKNKTKLVNGQKTWIDTWPKRYTGGNYWKKFSIISQYEIAY